LQAAIILFLSILISLILFRIVRDDPELKLARYEDEPFTKPAKLEDGEKKFWDKVSYNWGEKKED